ncbi:SpoIIE-like protein phosphatase domain protein [Leptospira wolbachii serovar Codice str. CDC]|uniref:SpoIIE-like protein phosphatase domain protein n=1 Tax=Leptospira wolbachii serovar Codice str. CDC TaxID=1218599 RepID=R8ZXZ4_9LEPT|nr:fused response regulator/phosphatase [Leptospira wolbachii]EOQ94836.1 SpoIIE-like protein phosphatase domain protein [Leptospira wolbachii serovar Codice str. CDC]
MHTKQAAKILVVDDNETNIEIITHILLNQGYEVAVAYDGEYALELAEALDFDLILLDILLPGISGLDVAKRLLTTDRSKNTPILFLSALNETSDIVKGLETGAVDYITKPFQETEILARIRTHIKIKTLEKERIDLLQAIQKDLELAKANQENLVTFQFPPSPLYQIYTSYKPMDLVGGDLITYDLLPSGDLDILFGDVTGHGIAAAMISLMAIITFKTMDKSFLSPSESLYWIHSTLTPLISTHFISAIYIRYKAEENLLSYSMAGHHSMFLIRDQKITKLGTKGFCLMMFPDQLNAENEDLFLSSGDRLFLFSDGMFEVPNDNEEYLGDQKFSEIIESRIHLSGREFLDSVQEEVLDYSGGKVADDMTMLLLEIK